MSSRPGFACEGNYCGLGSGIGLQGPVAAGFPRKRSVRRVLSLAAVLACGALLGGCGTFAELTAKKPIPSGRFVLPDDRTDVVGTVQVAVARHEDTLPDFARRYDLGHDEIVAANPGVDVWLPGKGTRILLPTQFVLPAAPRKGVVINLAALRLFYYPPRKRDEPQVVITHPIGIGREGWRTPVGTMSITQKIRNPVWVPTPSVRREHASRGDRLPAVVKAGPDNPLGLYAMRLSRPHYLLHSTNKPGGVGMRVSHGCMRLYPEDIAALFDDIPVGTKVRVVNQPYLAGWKEGQLYFEAHRPLAEDANRWKGSLKPAKLVLRREAGKDASVVDWDRAKAATEEGLGIPQPISPGSPDMQEVISRARHVPRVPPWSAQVDQDESVTIKDRVLSRLKI